MSVRLSVPCVPTPFCSRQKRRGEVGWRAVMLTMVFFLLRWTTDQITRQSKDPPARCRRLQRLKARPTKRHRPTNHLRQAELQFWQTGLSRGNFMSLGLWEKLFIFTNHFCSPDKAIGPDLGQSRILFLIIRTKESHSRTTDWVKSVNYIKIWLPGWKKVWTVDEKQICSDDVSWQSLPDAWSRSRKSSVADCWQLHLR